MRPAADLEDYHRAPEGTYVAGATWLHLASDRAQFATFLWGRPRVADIQALVEALRAEMTDHAACHASYADVSRLEAIDLEAYAALAAYLHSVRATSASRIRAQAVVFGPGLPGSVAAGFFTTYAAPFPFQAFATAEPAASWLGVAPETFAAWQAVLAHHVDVPAELRQLRSWLADAAPNATLGLAARELAVSERTLQRRLLDHRTSFRRELDEVRLARARARLEARNDKLAELAGDLGFASHQHFSDWFRKLTGVAPSEYRAKLRSR